MSCWPGQDNHIHSALRTCQAHDCALPIAVLLDLVGQGHHLAHSPLLCYLVGHSGTLGLGMEQAVQKAASMNQNDIGHKKKYK